ncbi:hypothetical protein F5887DRAFT_953722 [Amanita rubescens]|nr:hypothetical protein F5887DRAFT_953722 [Amanita rubescens]
MRSTDETHNETRLPYESESDTATNSSDEFDRDHEDEDGIEDEKNLKAKRGRRLWLTFLKLARPIRVLLAGKLGVAILIIPLPVVNLRFRESRVKLQIYVWSLWLAVIWAASCGTYLVVDAICKSGGKLNGCITQLESQPLFLGFAGQPRGVGYRFAWHGPRPETIVGTYLYIDITK